MTFSLHHLKGVYYQQFIRVDVKLDHLSEVVFVWFLHHEIPLVFPSFHAILFGKKLLGIAHAQGIGGYAPHPCQGSIY